ncbi:MAG: hypothetical protein R3F17_01275 [Planctomycetota bacterium]
MQQRSAEMQGLNEPKPGMPTFEGVLGNSVLGVDETVRATETLHLEALKGDMDFTRSPPASSRRNPVRLHASPQQAHRRVSGSDAHVRLILPEP